MGIEALIAALVGVAGIVGGYVGGKRTGKASELGIANDTVTLLQASIEELKNQNAAKDVMIVDLTARVELLEAMVTQRAEVDAVHEEVKGVRVVVDRIASKIDA